MPRSIRPWFSKTGGGLRGEKASQLYDSWVLVFGGENPLSLRPWSLKTGGVLAWGDSGLFLTQNRENSQAGWRDLFPSFCYRLNHLSCDVLKRPEIPRVCFNVLRHRIKDRTSPTELNVFTELVLPLLELLSPATTVHLEPSDLAHALSALQMAYDLSGGTSIKE